MSAFPKSVLPLLTAICVLFFWSVVGTACFAQAPAGNAVSSLLKKSIEAQSVVDRSSMKVVTEMNLDYPDNRPKKQRCELLLRRDGDLFDITATYRYLDLDQKRSYKERAVLNKTHYIYHKSLLDAASSKPSAGLVAKKARTEEGQRFLHDQIYGTSLDGRTDGCDEKRISEILLETPDARIRGTELIGGVPCEVIEGHTHYGVATIWIAPSKGYCCLKLILDRTGNDSWFGKSLSRQPPWSPSGLPNDLKAIERVLTVLENVKVEQIDGHFVVTEADCTNSIFRKGWHNGLEPFSHTSE